MQLIARNFFWRIPDLIEKMILITKEKGSYTAELNYSDILYNIPYSIKMSFDVKNQKMPAMLTGDLESYVEEEELEEVSKGTITIHYSNHQF